MKADILDVASEYEQEQREIALANTKAAFLRNRLNKTGKCHNCEDALRGADELFCDTDCQEDFEFRQSRSQANIRVT